MKFDFHAEQNQVARSLMEEAVGHVLLEHVAGIDVSLEKLAAVMAVKLLNEILDIMDDLNLDDEQCIEEIVKVLADYSLRTVRHDS